jgi:N-acylglucosamine 2-epimerase
MSWSPLAHAFLADGRCAFLLSEDGNVKDAIPGRGPAPSIYADCFVMMGCAEFARASGDQDMLGFAWKLFEDIERRIAAGGFPTHPEPTPAGYHAHGIAMIYLNLTLVLADACERLADARTTEARARTITAASKIFDGFLLPGGRIAEMRPQHPEESTTLLSRHVNPGHALEGLWMLLTMAARIGREDWLQRAHEGVRFALERGWDEKYGGLLHYVDCDGGPPTGRRGESAYEVAVGATWDTKLWWVHSEAIYASALSYRLSGDDAMRQWFERLWEYAFRVFPQPDALVGEWIQIRDRKGEPLERVVALPVKDPYHIARNLIQMIELFSDEPKGASK